MEQFTATASYWVVFVLVFGSLVIREGMISERKQRTSPVGRLLRKLWEAYPRKDKETQEDE